MPMVHDVAGLLLAVVTLTSSQAAAHLHRCGIPARPRALMMQRCVPPRFAARDGEAADRRHDALNVEFATIAVPALAQFAAEPLAGLVDTAYLGRLGASALGGAGVAISAHFATAKLLNDPLLRTSISIVASGDGAARRGEDGADTCGQAISAALVLALVVGLLQALFFLACAPALITMMGAPAGSPMRPTALSYLRVRALGAPAATVWLVANGIFRGLGDTRTPLAWALLFSALNGLLDPLLIFPCKLGAAGAAAGTALSQSVALLGLLRVLHRRTGVALSPRKLLAPATLRRTAPALQAYGQAGVLVFLRTWGKVGAYTYCSRTAAQLGSVASAAHLLCFNLGVILSQLCESVAVASQTLLARAMGALSAAESADEAANATADAWHVMRLGCGVGAAIASGLTLLTALRPSAVVAGLTTDAAVREACGGILGPVLACQLFKGLAFPSNGIIMGGLDWGFAVQSIWIGSALCVALVHTSSPPSLHSIWLGLAGFMASQTLLSVARVASRSGPWARLYPHSQSP